MSKIVIILCIERKKEEGCIIDRKGQNMLYPPKTGTQRLKAAEEENITAYIYGVSGIGKTELIVRYLKTEKISDV